MLYPDIHSRAACVSMKSIIGGGSRERLVLLVRANRNSPKTIEQHLKRRDWFTRRQTPALCGQADQVRIAVTLHSIEDHGVPLTQSFENPLLAVFTREYIPCARFVGP